MRVTGLQFVPDELSPMARHAVFSHKDSVRNDWWGKVMLAFSRMINLRDTLKSVVSPDGVGGSIKVALFTSR